MIDGRLWAWGHEAGQGEGWQKVSTGSKGISGEGCFCASTTGPWLRPATLPPMLLRSVQGGRVRFAGELGQDPAATPIQEAHNDQAAAARRQKMLDGEASMEIPAGRRIRAIFDLEQYYCGYPKLTVSGGSGATVRLAWAESLYSGPKGNEKGHRDEIEGKYFRGRSDRFILDGAGKRIYRPLWWQAGRYLQISVEAGDEPVTLDSLEILETHYPLSIDSELAPQGDDRLTAALPVLRRGLLMCMHETYMDCPFGEHSQALALLSGLLDEDRQAGALAQLIRPDVGMIEVQLTRDGDDLHGAVTLPEGLGGEVVTTHGSTPLQAGRTTF